MNEQSPIDHEVREIVERPSSEVRTRVSQMKLLEFYGVMIVILNVS
jgi:hypothetical protein